jgi:hypothetical protein
MASCGMTQAAISRALGVDEKTLRKHFRRALDSSADRANAQVGATLFKLATSGNCPAATIFWVKSRLGWRETTRLEHSGPDGAPLLPLADVDRIIHEARGGREKEKS